MSMLRRAFMNSTERRGADGALEWGNTVPPTNGMLSGSSAGVNISEKTALQIAAVYGSVGVIADAVSTLPVRLVDSHSPTRKELKPSRLLSEPYSEISVTDWWTQFTISLALRGNFFGEIIERDQERYPTQIKPVHPDRVGIRRLPNGTVEYRFNGYVVAPNNVFHVRYLSVAGSLMGLNPIEYLRNILGLARAEDLYGGAWFANSAMPSGTIEVDDDLDAEETLRLAREWTATHQGVGQAALPAVLTGGAKFHAISITPEDSQFLGSRAFSQSVISGQIFRVPPHMIGIVDRSTSWGRGIEQQETGFVRNTLEAYLTRGERSLGALHPPNQFVEFNRDYRMRGDTMERYQSYALAMSSGLRYADEIRAEEALPPLPNGVGKVVVAPINAEPVLKMLEEIKEGKTPEKEGGQSPNGSVPSANGVASSNGHAPEMRFTHHIEPHITVPVSVQPSPAPEVNVRTAPVNVAGAQVHVEPRIVVPEPTVTVAPPEVRVEAPQAPNVTVEAPNVNVEAPNVNVSAPEVRVAPPNVTVEAPQVVVSPRIEPADTKVIVREAKPKNKRVERDQDGNITRVVEEN